LLRNGKTTTETEVTLRGLGNLPAPLNHQPGGMSTGIHVYSICAFLCVQCLRGPGELKRHEGRAPFAVRNRLPFIARTENALFHRREGCISLTHGAPAPSFERTNKRGILPETEEPTLKGIQSHV